MTEGINTNPAESRNQYYRAVGRVLFRVLLANLAVAGLKITLGALTGALAVVADGFHSLVDSSSNLIGLASVRLADRPADDRHPYGYRRYETIGALAIGVMLFAAGFELAREILDRLVGGAQAPNVSPLIIGIYVLTIPVNLGVVIYETRAGRRLNSSILLADAAHTRADLFVTGSVLLSLLAALMGYPGLDLIVTAAVVLLIMRAAVRILLDTARWLTDAGFAEVARVEQIAQSVPGVLYVHRVRSRGTPDAGFVDLHVKVDPGMSTSQSHAIASEVERRLKDQIPNLVDVLVHIEPGQFERSRNWERIYYDMRQIADGMGLGIHDLHVHMEEDGNYVFEMHLEMAGDLSLGEAHALAEEFESRVRHRWPRAIQIITHMEPLPDTVLGSTALSDGHFGKEVRQALVELVEDGELLETRLNQIGGKDSVAVRVSFPADYSLEKAHSRAEQVEREMLVRFPDLQRVIVHVEPQTTFSNGPENPPTA